MSQKAIHVMVIHFDKIIQTPRLADPGHPTGWIGQLRGLIVQGREPSNVPFHPLRSLFRRRGDLAEFLAQLAHVVNGRTHVIGEGLGDFLPHNAGQLRAVSVGADHHLQRTVAMHAPKVEVALRRHIGNVGGYPLLLAQLPHLCGGFGVVNGAQDHVRVVEVCRLEVSVDVRDLAFGDSKGDLIVQTGGRADDYHFCIGVEGMEDPASSYL